MSCALLQVVVTGNLDMDKEGQFIEWGKGFVTEMDVLIAIRHPEVQTVIVPHTEEERFREVQSRMKDVEGVGEVTFVGAETIWDAVAIAFHKDMDFYKDMEEMREAPQLDEEAPPMEEQILNTSHEIDSTRGTCAAPDLW